MKRLPLFNLSAQHQPLKNEIILAWEKIFDSNDFTHGKDTDLFEKAFARLCDTKFAVGVRSGTASLILALKAIGIKRGDEVITTPCTFVATADAISLVGGVPIFVDVDPQTGNIDPDQIERNISSKTKAVLVVHLYGVPCEMGRVMEICRRHDLQLLEDASHAHGSLYNKQPVGSFGVAGCFSLYPSKSLGATGNAGVITSNNEQFINQVRMIANHGIKDVDNKYTHYQPGYNELIDNLQATTLLIKLKYLKKWIKAKRKITERYNSICHEFGHPGMHWTDICEPSLYVYAFQIRDRTKFQNFFNKALIDTAIYYPIPLHQQPTYAERYKSNKKLNNAERFFKHTVSLPIYPEMTENDQERVCSTLKKYFRAENS